MTKNSTNVDNASKMSTKSSSTVKNKTSHASTSGLSSSSSAPKNGRNVIKNHDLIKSNIGSKVSNMADANKRMANIGTGINSGGGGAGGVGVSMGTGVGTSGTAAIGTSVNPIEGQSANGMEEQEAAGKSTAAMNEDSAGTVDLSALPTDVYQSSETETAEQIVEARGYVLQEKLGAGAFANVYKAWHVHEQFYAACKVIEMRKKKRKRLNDLKHELYVLERMDHAHIVKLYEHFIIDERVYIFMECAAGGTLSEHVRRRGPLKELRARRWFKQICSAVHHMHCRGISHRDLKLGNILLDEQKQCKITDFGLSRVSYRAAQGILYCSSYCGTEPYMAPEILKKDDTGKRCYDPLMADIWALGVCLYAMINKAYPFNPEDKEAMVANQLQRKWKFVKKQRYRLSGELKDLVRHMLEPDPRKRITFLGIASHPWLTEQLADASQTNCTLTDDNCSIANAHDNCNVNINCDHEMPHSNVSAGANKAIANVNANVNVKSKAAAKVVANQEGKVSKGKLTSANKEEDKIKVLASVNAIKTTDGKLAKQCKTSNVSTGERIKPKQMK